MDAAVAHRFRSVGSVLLGDSTRLSGLSFLLAFPLGVVHAVILRTRWFATHPRRTVAEVATVSPLAASTDALARTAWTLMTDGHVPPVLFAMLAAQAAVGWVAGRIALQSVDPSSYPGWDRPAVRVGVGVGFAVALTILAVSGYRNGLERVRVEERLAELVTRFGGNVGDRTVVRPNDANARGETVRVVSLANTAVTDDTVRRSPLVRSGRVEVARASAERFR